MHAVNHAITALAIKKVAKPVPLAPLLLSVQAIELMWVGFHCAGVEWTTIDEPARSVADVHLAHMPWSHSLLMTGVVALVFAAAGFALWRKWIVALALGAGVLSHIALDLLIHAPDIQIAPFLSDPKYGLGFYGAMPIAAWGIELGYGLLVWWWVRGGKGLLALVLLFNAAAFTSYMPFIGGEMNPDPMAFAQFVAIQIAITLPLMYVLAPKWMRAGTDQGKSSTE